MEFSDIEMNKAENILKDIIRVCFLMFMRQQESGEPVDLWWLMNVETEGWYDEDNEYLAMCRDIMNILDNQITPALEEEPGRRKLTVELEEDVVNGFLRRICVVERDDMFDNLLGNINLN